MNKPINPPLREGKAKSLSPSPLKSRKRHIARNMFLLLFIPAVAVSIWWMGGGDKAVSDMGSTYVVSRGDLRISVIEGGSLKAQKSVKIECEVEGQSTVVFLIPEGSYVKKGDLLVQLDSSDLEERFTQQEITYESAKADKIQAEESLKIQVSQNKSNIMAGELEVTFGQMELDKYLKQGGSRELERTQLLNDINIAKAELARAKNNADWTRTHHEKGFVTAEDLQADLLTLERRKNELEEAEKQLVLNEDYDFPMTEQRLMADVEEAKLGLERIQRRAESELAQQEANLKSQDAKFRLQEERFNKLKEQLEKCNIHAPQDGLVVYGAQDNDRHGWGGSDEMIEEGATVRYRQTLITLPDVSVMMVDTKVHESAVDKVRVGMKTQVTVDAFPDDIYRGDVTKVAILPDSQSRWLNPDLKVYSTDITLENGSGKLKPGMSAKVEIIVDQLKQVISVPIQSVYRRGGHEVCYVKSSGSEVEIRPVEVGMNNDQFVVIEEGLVEGEKVLLFEPSMGDSQEDKSSPDPESAAQRGETPENPVEGSSRETDARQDESQRPRAMQPEGVERAMPAGAPTEEMRNTFEKFKDMTPEEREKAMEKMRAEGGFPSGGRDRGRDRGSDRSRGEKPDQGE